MSDVQEEGSVTAGALLRDARQAAGIHIAALAVALKVPVSKLEALEADNYQALPDTVFVRALASSMCRTLKIDPGPVLSLLPQAKSPRLSTDGGGINAPVKGVVGKSSSSSSPSSFSTRPASRSVSLVVLALLAGALALVFLPRQQDKSGVPDTVTSAPGAAIDAGEPAAAAVASIASEPQAAAPAGTTGPTAQASTDGQAEAVAGAPASVANSGASAPVSAASVAATPGGVLVLRARGETWVQVRDATGAVALQRSLVAGEVASVAGPAPLAVVVGRADMTEVIVRGKVFDLTAVSRENVARFEVK
jgi:cytoskeleton protein RodZ